MRVLGVCDGNPWYLETWSGIPHALLSALGKLGCDVDAVPLEPLNLERRLAVWQMRLEHRRDAGAIRQSLWTNFERSRSAYAFRSRVLRRVLSRSTSAADRSRTVVLSFSCPVRPDPRAPLVYLADAPLAACLAAGYIVYATPALIAENEACHRQMFGEASGFLCASQWGREQFRNQFPELPQVSGVVGFGTHWAADEPATAPLHRREGSFLFVGTDWERKGGPLLLDAFARLKRQRPEVTLDIVGPPNSPLGPGIAESGGVVWHGPLHRSVAEERARLLELFRTRQYFVMPSLFEPFGIVYVEAMAQGALPVALDRTAIREIFDAGTGFLCERADPDALTATLAGALDASPDALGRMVERARERARTLFSWEAVARRALPILEEAQRHHQAQQQKSTTPGWRARNGKAMEAASER